MSRVIHFDISADDPERAKEFYEKVFGWEISKWAVPEPKGEEAKKIVEEMSAGEDMGYWMIKTGEGENGINGGLSSRRDNPKTGNTKSYVCTIDVASIDETKEKIEANGGKALGEKMPIPGMGWLQNFEDSEGNIVGMIEEDRSV